jgi:ABC-type multidrug transport system fused ATPase/permease subunit
MLKNIFRSVGISLRFAPWITVSLFLITAVIGLLPLYQAKVMGDIVNNIIDGVKTLSVINLTIIGLIIAYASMWGFTRILSELRLFLDKKWGLFLEEGTEILILKKRAEIDLGHYENPDFQNLLQRAFNRGIWPILNSIESQFDTFTSILTIIFATIVTAQLGWDIYLIVIISSIPGFIVQLKYGKRIWHIWAENSSRQRKYAHIRSLIQGRIGVTQTKILQNSNFLIETAREILSKFRLDQQTVDTKKFLYSSITSLISAIGFGISFYMIGKNVVAGLISIGSMVFVVSALGQLVGSINSLLRSIAQEAERNLYVTDIYKVLDTTPFIQRAKHPQKINLTQAPLIEFKNVWFKYEGREDWILKNINIVFEPGKKFALVGENGAGKSTFIKLLSRIYDPSRGAIFVNGVDLRMIDVNEWSSALSVLLQDYVNYDFKAVESIAMGKTNKSIDYSLAKESSILSGADEFISTWKHKYDQQLGKEFDEGIEPSKGQNQKIALARTIYRSGFVMILDEPTAAIDARSEMEIFENMEKASGKATLVLITHRFNTTQTVDRIFVLDHGEIKESGNHKELLKHNGLYAGMFKAQAKSFLQKKED